MLAMDVSGWPLGAKKGQEYFFLMLNDGHRLSRSFVSTSYLEVRNLGAGDEGLCQLDPQSVTCLVQDVPPHYGGLT